MFSLAAILFILYLGVDSLGGVARIFQINEEGGRLEFFKLVCYLIVMVTVVKVLKTVVAAVINRNAIHGEGAEEGASTLGTRSLEGPK